MEIILSAAAKKDIKHWHKTHNSAIMERITELLHDIMENQYEGIGNPEQLKHTLSGFWSRRISGEHRLIYRICENGDIEVASCRYHY